MVRVSVPGLLDSLALFVNSDVYTIERALAIFHRRHIVLRARVGHDLLWSDIRYDLSWVGRMLLDQEELVQAFAETKQLCPARGSTCWTLLQTERLAFRRPVECGLRCTWSGERKCQTVETEKVVDALNKLDSANKC